LAVADEGDDQFSDMKTLVTTHDAFEAQTGEIRGSGTAAHRI
jgi:hypothetical protein